MKCTVWWAALLVASCLYKTRAVLDPGQQAKVTSALDSAQFFLDFAHQDALADLNTVTESLKVTETTKLLDAQNKLMKTASKVGRALKAVQAVSVVASFIFTFFMPSDLDVITGLINERFKEVNAKLDNLDAKLDQIEISIKANNAFNTFLNTWITWESTSKNGAKKLSEIRQAMSRVSRRIDKVKLAAEYINYYDTNNLDGNLLNLYRMAALSESTTNRNIFDRFIAEYGCDIFQLSQLMIIIQNVMTSAAQLKLTYYFLKGDEVRATNGFTDVQTYFFAIRRAFDDRVWKCRSNSIYHAKNDATKMLTTMKGQAKETVVKALFDELKVKYPWYTWAVAAVSDHRSTITGLERRGATYFTVVDRSDPAKVNTYILVHEDVKALTYCTELQRANTLLVFKRCDGCNADYIYTADNILSGKKCLSNPSSPLQPLVPIKDELLRDRSNMCPSCTSSFITSYYSRRRRSSSSFQSSSSSCFVSACEDKLKKAIDSLDFIASAVNIRYDVCGTTTCGSNGQCKSIPFTKSTQCICNSYYEGAVCEKRISFDNTIETLMSELRLKYNVVNGVPTAVDVYFSIKSLSQQLAVVLEKIKSSFKHTNNIIQHSSIIYNAEDVADLYGKLQKNELSFQQFGYKINSYLTTVTQFELQNRLRKMILGQGLLDTAGDDIYNSYKREYATQNGGGCAASYNTDIKNFKDNLAALDQAIGEAFLLHQKWLIETKGTTVALRAQYAREAAYIRDQFKDRQDEYNKYWNSYSCGDISVAGTVTACKAQLTFDGMVIPMQCDQQRQATPSELRCTRVNGVMTWNTPPVCKFVWGNYGSWSSCSKTCDSGVQYMIRSCLGTANAYNCVTDQGGLWYQARSCNTQACCSAQYGKYKCSNGGCIQRSWLCDGDNDCGNGDDESHTNCPNMIRSGDMIAMESLAWRGEWLSCYCTVNCGWDRCKLDKCPGSTMNGNDWSTCHSQSFLIHGLDRSSGDAIRHGDRIGIQYSRNSATGAGNWLSCWVSGSVCPTRGCPGSYWTAADTTNCRGEYFWIFSPDRRNTCSSDILSGCRGKPLENSDDVFVLYGTPSWFLSEDGGSIKTNPCPGRYIEQSDKTHCKSEAWKIFRRY